MNMAIRLIRICHTEERTVAKKDEGYIKTKNAKGLPAGRKPDEMNRVPGSDQPMSNKPVSSRPTKLSGGS